MAAALPAIHPRQGMTTSPTIQQHRVPSPPQKGSPSASSGKLYLRPIKRVQGKRDRDILFKKEYLREELPDLSKQDTSAYRNSYKHNLSLDMLQEGFHKSFAELFALIKQQHDDREQAGPESALWNASLLEDEPEKLDALQVHLTQAEAALRKEDYTTVYSNQHSLARYFQSTGDKWLADHFFNNCLMTSKNVKTDGGVLKADGHCNVGLALEESGHYFEAAENFEDFHKLASAKKDWQDNEGISMHTIACDHLTRIYTTIGKQMEQQDPEQSLAYLVKAFNMAKEGGDKKREGEASYRLGQAYERNGDAETALLYLNGYLETCKSVQDNKGIGKACEAIAKAYESQGKIEESIKFLETFAETAEQGQQEEAYGQACSDLGAIFNSLGNYPKSTEFFSKAYNISRSLNQTNAIHSSRVFYGISSAHNMLQGVADHINIASHPCLERLVEWKNNRGDEFEKPLPGSNSS